MSFAGTCPCHGINLKCDHCGEQVARPDLPQEIAAFRRQAYLLLCWSGSHELDVDLCEDCGDYMTAIQGILHSEEQSGSIRYSPQPAPEPDRVQQLDAKPEE